MRKLIIILSILLTKSLLTVAQAPFSSYYNSFHNYENQILISLKQQNFTLWITGLPVGEEDQMGGIAIRETLYLPFCEQLSSARDEYSKWKQALQHNTTTKINRSLRMFVYSDAFFKTDKWHYATDLLLKFNLVAETFEDSTYYYLVINTGTLTSNAINNLKSPGFSIIFSSEQEVDQFLEAISRENINTAIAKFNPLTEKIKQANIDRREKIIDNRPFMSKIELGIHAGFSSALGANNRPAEPNNSYSLLEPMTSTLELMQIGAFGRYFYKNFFVQPEISYLQGHEYNYINFLDGSMLNIKSKNEKNLQFVNIPLLLGYKLLNKNKLGVSVALGPQLNIDLQTNSTITYFHTLGTGNENAFTAKRNKQQTGLALAAQFEYSRFIIGARYNLFFQNHIETAYETRTYDKLIPSSFSFTAAWKLFEPIR